MNDTFDFIQLTSELTEDEGRRNFPYLDTMGLVTIGIGRNLTGRGLSDLEIILLFGNDVTTCCDSMDKNIPWWRKLPTTAQRVMINLCFNMGWARFALFNSFFEFMKANEWQLAANDLVNTNWYHEVGLRGPRVCARLTSLLQV